MNAALTSRAKPLSVAKTDNAVVCLRNHVASPIVAVRVSAVSVFRRLLASQPNAGVCMGGGGLKSRVLHVSLGCGARYVIWGMCVFACRVAPTVRLGTSMRLHTTFCRLCVQGHAVSFRLRVRGHVCPTCLPWCPLCVRGHVRIRMPWCPLCAFVAVASTLTTGTAPPLAQLFAVWTREAVAMVAPTSAAVASLRDGLEVLALLCTADAQVRASWRGVDS
jgi:hypothetical protein